MNPVITSVKTEYTVDLNASVILTDETHYEDPKFTSRTSSTVEATSAVVTLRPGSEPYVCLYGYYLLSSGGRRSRRQKEATSLHEMSIVTFDKNMVATTDTSAFDAVVASVLAEVNAHIAAGV